MRIHFVAADLEENLGVGILAAVAENNGHRTSIVSFNDVSETESAAARAMAGDPDIIGLSIQFQHRAHEFLGLSRRLRAMGYRGHITCGGQFPTLAWRETLDPKNGLDTVVLHDGEETIVDLFRAMEKGEALTSVRGIAVRGEDGVPLRTDARRLLDDLDSVPFPKRYRHHNHHMSVPFIPILGGRGCWGKCSYCSIIAFYDDAIDAGGGRAVRLRSPANVAAEMALLLEGAGGRGIFCFHDDNFVFPGEAFSRRRIRAIRAALDEYGVGRVAMVGKARPDCITPSLAKELAELGVIRLYVGVENGSEAGGEHLVRGTQQTHIRGALKACREAGIFVCYNLLIFEPEATIDDIRENARFVRDHADHPVNFCRAEPYYGTALHEDLSTQQDLGGSYLGFNYRIKDPKTELLFRVCSAAFRERNFAPNGVANRYMGLGYAANVLRRFYDKDGNTAEISRRALLLTRDISLDTAGYLEKAIAIVENADIEQWDRIERETALLGLEIAAADKHWHEELDLLYADMRAFAEHPPEPVVYMTRPTASFHRLKRGIALGLSLAAAATIGAAEGCSDETTAASGAASASGGEGGKGSSSSASAGEGGMVVDPLPPDGGFGGMGGSGGVGGVGGQAGEGGMVVDPPPPDAGASIDILNDERVAAKEPRKLRLIDQWFDTSPKTTVRTVDLPLFDPPRPKLSARREGDLVVVMLDSFGVPVSTRWEANGDVIGAGAEVRWRPSGACDRIRVAVRSRGGVAVVSLRQEDVKAAV